MPRFNAERRGFLKQAGLTGLLPFVMGCSAFTGVAAREDNLLDAIKKNAISDPDCSWCGARDVPRGVSWQTSLASASEPGEKIAIEGTIYSPDGKTPAPEMLIYLYHTDIHGIYGRTGEHRHGRFRGWMLTNPKGQFKFTSILPASYPDSTIAKHIHMTVTGREFKEEWVDSILFEGDPFITARERTPQRGGFDPVLKLSKGSDGVLRGTRDIRLW